MKVTGVNTSGAEPRSFGRGCEDALPAGTTPLAAPTPSPLPLANELFGGFPNPFVESTSVRFALAQPGRVQLTVYDVSGRRVRRIVDAEHPAGFHAVPWSGRDDEGHLVPAGVYFVRLQAGGFRETMRVARLGIGR